MGQIRRKSLINNVLTYAGFAIGAFNLLVLFNWYLTKEEIGLTRVFFAVASIIGQFSMLSMNAAAVKFFPYFKGNLINSKNDFLKIFILRTILGSLIVFTMIILFKPDIILYFQQKSMLVGQYFNLILVFSFIYVLFGILDNYALVNHLSVSSSISKEVFTRLITSLLVLLYGLKLIDFNLFILVYSALYILPLLYLVYILKQHNIFKIIVGRSKVYRRVKKSINLYSLYMYSGLLIAIIASQVDSIFIAGMIGLGSTTIFLYADYFATLILVPYRSFANVVSPVFAECWREKNYEKLSLVYKSSALNQFIASLFIFGIIWLNIDSIYSFLDADFKTGIEALFILCMARILDIAFGLNSELLTTSSKWQFNFFSYVGFLIVFIPTNYLLIKQYGISGAAFSNLITFFCLNISRFLYIWYNFKFQPFSKGTGITVLIFSISYCLAYFIPKAHSVWVSIPLTSVIFAVPFLSLIIITKASADVNNFLLMLYNKVLNR